MDHREEVRGYLKQLLDQKGDTHPFTDDASLLLSGRLASADAVEIVVFLEEKFGVDFAAAGFDQSLIDSVDAIESLIHTVKK
jgi:acyl carrier protein